jgi:membrane associated rhomboid family serine protease
LKFPYSKIGFLWRFGWSYYFRWISMPAYCALVLWGLEQVMMAGLQLKGLSHISALAHIGGALTGLFLWILWRKTERVL